MAWWSPSCHRRSVSGSGSSIAIHLGVAAKALDLARALSGEPSGSASASVRAMLAMIIHAAESTSNFSRVERSAHSTELMR
jgi:hypothetical protein